MATTDHTNGDDVRIDVYDDEFTPLIRIPSSGSFSVQSIQPLPGMKIRAHSIDADGNLQSCKSKEALAKGRTGQGHYWIDIDADDRDTDELLDWLDQLRLSHFLLARLAEPSQTWETQVLAFKKTTLAVIQILPTKESSDDMAHLAALSIRNLLLTFNSCRRSETGGLYAHALEFMKSREGLPDASSSGALFAWLLFHIERTSRAMRELRTRILKLDESMDRDPSSLHLEEIIAAKEQLLRLLTVAEEQVEFLEALAGAEADTEALDFSKLRGALGVLKATAGATERMSHRLEKNLSELRHRHEMHQQEGMNRRLACLTVVSAIFMPLTLFTGIWGMNFAYMPELQFPDAYPLALIGMLTVASSMLCYFWRTGWFE